MLNLGLLLTAVLLLSSRHTDTQFIKYNDHYYTFHHALYYTTPEEWSTFCFVPWITDFANLPDRYGPQSPGYPVVLNDADEHREIYKFYLNNSQLDDAFVFLGASKRNLRTEYDVS